MDGNQDHWEMNEDEWDMTEEDWKRCKVVYGDDGHTVYYDYGDGNGLVGIGEDDADRLIKEYLNRKRRRDEKI